MKSFKALLFFTVILFGFSALGKELSLKEMREGLEKIDLKIDETQGQLDVVRDAVSQLGGTRRPASPSRPPSIRKPNDWVQSALAMFT